MNNEKILQAADEMADAVGRLIEWNGLSDLGKRIFDLKVCLNKYDKAVMESKNEKEKS